MKKKIEHLHVSETFYSIQGEGQTMGVPAVFLRLTGCNLLCESDGWRCDTIEVWRKGTKIPFDKVFRKEEQEALECGAHLIITGGEPMLHQKAIEQFICWYSDTHHFLPVIEIETNGTIMPSQYLLSFVKYWNCSPKLPSSGEPIERCLKGAVLERLSMEDNAIFKFVICTEEDLHDIRKYYLSRIDEEKIWLMPAGASKEELEVTRQLTADIAKNEFWRYSERLHIDIWDQKTGV